MVEVVVSRLGLDPTQQSYVIVLREKNGDRLLPIWIGQVEAESIVRHLHNVKRERPITHDLCKSVILALGARLRRVEITHVENNTYIAELHLERNGTLVRVDSRPSDAIAIAIRMDAPVFAADALLTRPEEDDGSSTLPFGPPVAEGGRPELTAEQLKAHLEHLRPEDFGKFNL